MYGGFQSTQTAENDRCRLVPTPREKWGQITKNFNKKSIQSSNNCTVSYSHANTRKTPHIPLKTEAKKWNMMTNGLSTIEKQVVRNLPGD